MASGCICALTRCATCILCDPHSKNYTIYSNIYIYVNYIYIYLLTIYILTIYVYITNELII